MKKKNKVKVELGTGTIIDIGVGRPPVEKGWITVDYLEMSKPHIIHNLDIFPYPFEDNSVDEIKANYIIEHLHYRMEALTEILRICKVGAKIEILLPHWSHMLAWSSVQHTRGFSIESFDMYKEQFTNCDGEKYFDVEKKEYYAYMMSMPKLGQFNQWLANKYPKLTELILCKFMPIQAVRFHLVVNDK